MLKLFLIFFKIGCLAFGGGYAVIPLISKYVVETSQILTPREFMDLVSISQMTPGPIAINAATFVGQISGGLIGSIVTTIGLVLPQFILMMVLGHLLFTKGKKFNTLDYALEGVKAGILPLILLTSIDLFNTSIFPEGFALTDMRIPALIGFVVGLLYIKKVDLFKLIAIGAIVGIGANYFL
ncbi:chromate transporter [Peptoniphilus sp.]|jgi:chromate transporter|uniref:chromate transporter n=1 Tax=Peptoniphilus sp. TaxID=1971214 RepID=UPI003D8F08B7